MKAPNGPSQKLLDFVTRHLEKYGLYPEDVCGWDVEKVEAVLGYPVKERNADELPNPSAPYYQGRALGG